VGLIETLQLGIDEPVALRVQEVLGKGKVSAHSVEHIPVAGQESVGQPLAAPD
jgi:hypothetical protein